ncbi:MAG: class I SAM-dependent RNA methyltransferase [Silicimonas sp.]|nr:class I SAM-dependent RNA methyltransferase [Silicimonas sp.]
MQVTVERLGHLGDGIADGPVYSARMLPGEVIEGDVEGNRMAAPRILRPAETRVSAPCRHYKGCGGCALQHATDKFVQDWKVGVVRTALSAVGIEAWVRRVHTSPPASRRRATFAGRRTKSGASVGFHAPASDIIRAVPDCLLVTQSLRSAMPFLEDIVEAGASRKGEIRLLATETGSGIDLDAQGGKPLTKELHTRLASLADKANLARLTWNDEPVATFRPPFQMFGTVRVVPPPGSFLQATVEGEAALRNSVEDALDGSGPVLDLFSGCGTFALPLAKTRPVHSVEDNAEMLAALDMGWRQGDGLSAVTTERRDLFRRPLTPDEMAPFSGVVIDPPRAGAERQMIELAQSDVSRIAFVSCNPSTFARDAALLVQAGYKLEWIDVVDQFRWSPHVELAAAFVR